MSIETSLERIAVAIEYLAMSNGMNAPKVEQVPVQQASPAAVPTPAINGTNGATPPPMTPAAPKAPQLMSADELNNMLVSKAGAAAGNIEKIKAIMAGMGITGVTGTTAEQQQFLIAAVNAL